MAGLNSSLEIGKRALAAQQVGLNVTGNNIANINTPGFARKRVELVTVVDLDQRFASIGTGVDTSRITRVRDGFLDQQVRSQLQSVGRWETLEKALRTIESNFSETAAGGASETGSIYNEPAGTGLTGSLSRFWNAWQDLANDPESGPPRAALREEADNLVNVFRLTADRLKRLREDFDGQVVRTLDRVNTLITQIADLNKSIFGLKEGQSSDLQDRRDAALDELATLVDIRTVDRGDGTVDVSIGGRPVVEGVKALYLAHRQVFDQSATISRVVTADDFSPVVITEGELGGLLEARDTIIPEHQGVLDDLARVVVTEVNALHRRGVGRTGSVNTAFFDPDGTTAATIDLSDDVRANLDTIAASADGNPGDNQIALMISSLRNSRLVGETGALLTGTVENTQELSGIEQPITASTTFFRITGANVRDGDTITITGTKHDGTVVSGTFVITAAATTTVQDLINQIQTIFGLGAGRVTVSSRGSLEIRDVQAGMSQLSVKLTANNEGGGSLNFGTFATKTIDNAYLQMVGDIGARTKEAMTMARNTRLLADQIEERRQSVQGVDLNEETTQLILFQRAYQAAARTVTVINGLMEEIVDLL